MSLAPFLEIPPVPPHGLLAQQGAIGPQGSRNNRPDRSIGPQGLTGPAGARGVSGPQGIPGTTGPSGPSGPAGPVGAIGPAGQSPAFPLASRHFSVQGDSITFLTTPGRTSSPPAPAWLKSPRTPAPAEASARQEYPLCTLGQPGRHLHPKRQLLHRHPRQHPRPGHRRRRDHRTRHQRPIRSTRSSWRCPGSGTFFGDMRWVVETYLAAKPSLRIVMHPAAQRIRLRPATTRSTSTPRSPTPTAWRFHQHVSPGGLNPLTSTILTVDGTHPNALRLHSTVQSSQHLSLLLASSPWFPDAGEASNPPHSQQPLRLQFRHP